MQTAQNVDPAHILSELNNLSESSAAGGIGKACLFNLIVYTNDPKKTDYFKKVIKVVIEQFPSRIIFIEGNPSSKNNDLQVSISTEKGVAGKGLICEEIFIQASGSDLSKVPFLLLPLYVPDLPIYLLWGQDPTSETIILPHLLPIAKRLIFDSEATEDLQLFSQKLIEQTKLCCLDIVDLNWARIGGWRELLAQTFDSSERYDQLATSNAIDVIYNNVSNGQAFHPYTQAIYLQAWIATRLNWQFVSLKRNGDTFNLIYQNSNGKHEITLIPESHESFPSGNILCIDVSGPKDYDCHLMRTDTNQVKVSAHNQDQCELPFTLLMSPMTSGRNFTQDILYQKVSAQYKPMLKLISLAKWSS